MVRPRSPGDAAKIARRTAFLDVVVSTTSLYISGHGWSGLHSGVGR